jgi:hypothetical protein
MKKLTIILWACLIPLLFAGCSPKPAEKKAETNDPNVTKTLAAVAMESYETGLNKYKVAFYYWYDHLMDGEIPPANVAEAGKKLDLALAEINTNSFDKAYVLLNQADSLLDVHVKSDTLFPYETDKPMEKQDASKVYKAKAKDYLVLERYGVKMNDVGPSIWGYCDDGEYYLITTFYNYHARGHIIKPVVVEVITTKDPTKRYVYLLNGETKITQTENSVEYFVEDGTKSFRTIITDDPVGGGTTCHSIGIFGAVEGRAPAISFDVITTPSFSYWYNQNLGAAMMYPDIVLAGFEQPGPAWGTITMDGKKATFNKTAGGVTEVCMISGAPGKQYDEYRTNMTRYGNEWYIPFHSDQLDGIFISYGKFRDGALWYKGKYIIPTSYQLIPGIADQTLTLKAKTKEYGELVLNFRIMLHDPVYTERVAVMDGSFDGQILTNGGAWFEHVFKGAPDGIKAVQESPQIVDPL